MALGGSHPRRSPRRSPRRKPPPTDLVEDELARDPGSDGGLHLGSTFPAPSCTPIPGPVQDLALIPAPALAPAPTDKMFKIFMKAYLESNQRPRPPPAEREQSLKVKVLEMYYGKLHMNCYHFCQQCDDHFETAGATGTNQTLFAAFFLCENISMRWKQYKRRHQGKELIPISWTESKTFLRKNLGESKSFVDSIWKKLK